jgi:hypothetical protein
MVCRSFLKNLYVPAGDIQLYPKGGAIYIDGGALVIHDSTFDTNTAHNVSG